MSKMGAQKKPHENLMDIIYLRLFEWPLRGWKGFFCCFFLVLGEDHIVARELNTILKGFRCRNLFKSQTL